MLNNNFEGFWAKVDKNGLNGCWLWLGAKTSLGYGHLVKGRKHIYAHRLSWEMEQGPIPQRLELDHLCRNPSCVNPAHLEAVTHRENLRRGIGTAALNIRKTHCPQGHPYDLLNTLYGRHGKRICCICLHTRERAYRARRKIAGKK